MNSIRIMMMNDTSLVRGVEELITASLLFEETQAPTGMTIREVPFAPWMIVILCLIAFFVIDILSPAEQVPDINDGYDSGAHLQRRPPLHQSLSGDVSSHSTSKSQRDETTRHAGRYDKVLDFIRNKARRSKKMRQHSDNSNTPQKEKQGQVGRMTKVQSQSSGSHSPRSLSLRKMIVSVNSNHQNQKNVTPSSSSRLFVERKRPFGQ
jgi:hypothetical protein